MCIAFFKKKKKYCKSCGKQIKESALFCHYCGKDQTEKDEMMRCPHCEKEIQKECIICHYCGKPIHETEETNSDTVSEQDSYISTYEEINDVKEHAIPFFAEAEPFGNMPYVSANFETMPLFTDTKEESNIEENKPILRYNDPALVDIVNAHKEKNKLSDEEDDEEIGTPSDIPSIKINKQNNSNYKPLTIANNAEEIKPIKASTTMETKTTIVEKKNLNLCKKCGAQIKEGSSFCHVCGTKLGEISATAKTDISSIQSNSAKVYHINAVQNAIDKANLERQSENSFGNNDLMSLKASLKALISVSIEPHTPNAAFSPEFNKQNVYIKNNITDRINSYINTADLGLFIRYKIFDNCYSGLPIKPTLSYNTHSSNENNMFGNYWHFNYTSFIYHNNGANIFTIIHDDNDEASFTTRQLDNGTMRVLIPMMHDTGDLVQIGNSFIYHSVEDLYYQYERMPWAQDFMLSAIADRYGNTLDLAYYDHKLLSITDPTGRIIYFAYDDKNKCNRITLPDTSYFAFEYDDADNLIAITDYKGKKTTFSYSEAGLLAEINDDMLNKPYKYEFDYKGMQPLVTNITDDEEKKTVFQRTGVNPFTVEMIDTNNNKSLFVSHNEMTISESLAENEENRICYNDKNQPVIIGNTEYTYDENGNCIEIMNEINNELNRFQYDDKNRLMQSTDIEDNGSMFNYNVANKLISATTLDETNTVKLEYNDKGFLISKSDDNDNEEIYEYDSFGNLTSITNNEGIINSYKYDEIGYSKIYDSNDNQFIENREEPIKQEIVFNCNPEIEINEIIKYASLN